MDFWISVFFNGCQSITIIIYFDAHFTWDVTRDSIFKLASVSFWCVPSFFWHLLSGVKRMVQTYLFLSVAQPWSQPFLQKPWFLLVENSVKNQYWGCVLQALWVDRASESMFAHTYIFTHTCMNLHLSFFIETFSEKRKFISVFLILVQCCRIHFISVSPFHLWTSFSERFL